MFLQIQNPGVAPVESFTLLGVSTTRDCGIDGAIGQFGTGTKHAINVLLRAGLKVVIYCGNNKLEFSTRQDTIDDGLIEKRIERVVCRTNTRTLDLGWVLEFGAIDWTDVSMALREFVSNAIDRTLREEGGFLHAIRENRLSVVPTENTRAKAGYTRVFVEMDESVQRFYGELPRRFLHFSDRPEEVSQTLLPKANRNPSGGKTPAIYRCGVFVREIEENTECGIYDYNFSAGQLQIDECRNSSEYAIRHACAGMLRTASATELVPVLRAAVDRREVFELSLDSYAFTASYHTYTDKMRQNWQNAWQAVAGEAVACSGGQLTELVSNKGYATKTLSCGWVPVLQRVDIKTETDILTQNEANGKIKTDPTPAAKEAVRTVWGWMDAYGLTAGKTLPEVWCYKQIMDAGTQRLGFCDGEGVHFEEAHASGLSKMLLQTALEECVHHVTQATDGSRDLQDFAFRMIVEALA